jgi:hypothetical protein
VCLLQKGILEKYGVELIGAKLESINKAEDRELFANVRAVYAGQLEAAGRMHVVPLAALLEGCMRRVAGGTSPRMKKMWGKGWLVPHAVHSICGGRDGLYCMRYTAYVADRMACTACCTHQRMLWAGPWRQHLGGCALVDATGAVANLGPTEPCSQAVLRQLRAHPFTPLLMLALALLLLQAMKKLNLKMSKSAIATTMEEALKAAEDIGGKFPLIIRPAFTLGGTGGGWRGVGV